MKTYNNMMKRLNKSSLKKPVTHREFKVTAVKEGRTMGDVTIELIRQYLKKPDPL
jgi:DNA-binding transcriptional regulator YiaG